LSNYSNTIVSVITPAGSGAVGVIRLSGEESKNIAEKIFQRKNASPLAARKVYFGKIVDTQSQVIDEVVLSYFQSPASFTGEDVVEIACHGSSFILQKVVMLCIEHGAMQAKAGEFTMRAYMNGKMDLSMAEAVADVIASENAAQHKIAMQQMRGGISTEMQALREKLIQLTALIELELDFAEEDVAFADRSELIRTINELLTKLKKLENSFQYGNAVKKGIPVAIIGKPNAGKSTLLNALLQEEKAIVSDIAGTTRDAIEDVIVIDGISFRIIDTAGLRESDDTIETIGVERAKQKANDAEIILYLAAATENYKEIIEEVRALQLPADKKIIVVLTKIDATNTCDTYDVEEAITTITGWQSVAISAQQNKHIDALTKKMSAMVDQSNTSDIVISNTRHLHEIKKTIDSLQLVQEGMTHGSSGDLLSIDLRSALQSLGNITGQIELDRDILGTIFSKFCIGK
jgi:tRNA modification GTPase